MGKLFNCKSSGHIIVIALLVIHLLPVWVFRYFPTQDGASHIYNSYVLKEHHKHENYRLREVYRLNLTLFPNWTSHAFMALLMYVLPPIVCEKILISICIALLPLSLFYFLNGIQKDKTLFGLIGFIYAYNYLLHMGFYNFVLSMSLFFFTLGYWWRHRGKLNIASIGIIYVLLLFTYLTHYQSYAMLMLSLTFFAVFLSLYEALQRAWGHREAPETGKKTLADSLKGLAEELKPTFLFLAAMLPAYFIMMSYYLDKTIGYGGDHSGFKELKEYFFSMKSLVSFRDDYILIGRVLLVVIAIALLLTFIDRSRRIYRFHRSPGSDKERLWTKIVTRDDQFLIMAVVLTIMYFRYPWYIESGGGWINDRIHLYIFLVLLPFFSVDLRRYVNYAVAGIFIVLSLWFLGYNVQTYYLLNRDIKSAVSWDVAIEKHTILTSRPAEWNGLADSFGRVPKYVEPFGHLECFLALENGIAYLANYEAETDHFPVNYKHEDRNWSAEYVVVWRTEYDDAGDLEDDYDLIHSNNYNRLYRRRKARSDEALWGGREKVEFDMQSHNGQTAPDHLAVYYDTIYTDGRYGWLTRSDRGELLSKADIPEPYKDGVWGEEDGVFRVALPNGEYEVTCYFCSGGSEPLEINLIANGEKRIKKLRLPTGNEFVEKSYNVTITDERLTQVIYTRRKGSYQRWGWNGCKIERVSD